MIDVGRVATRKQLQGLWQLLFPGHPGPFHKNRDDTNVTVKCRGNFDRNKIARLIEATGVRMIQWRTLNVAPDWYAGTVGGDDGSPRLGMPALLARLRERRPALRFGYFNPPAEDWR